MSSIRLSISVAANDSIDDILSSEFVRLQQRTAQTNGIYTSAFTQSGLGLEIDIIAGARIDSSKTQPVVSSVAPKLPDDLSGSFPIAQGEQVSIPVRNTTAGPLTLGLIIDVP